MTDPMMTLQSLLAKSSDAEFLRSMIKTVAKAGAGDGSSASG